MLYTKKYLVVLEDFDGRGSQRAAQNYAVYLKTQQWEVKALGLRKKGIRAKPLEALGIQIYIGLESDTVSQILNWNPTIIHIHRPGLSNALFNRFFEKISSSEALVLETNVFSRVDYFLKPDTINVHLHLSPWCLWKWQSWARILPYHPSGTVLPYSVDSEAFKIPEENRLKDFKSRLEIPAQDFVYGRVGAEDNAKWHPFLIDAFKTIYEQKHQVSLVLVTPSPSVVQRISQLPDTIRSKIKVLESTSDDQELSLRYAIIDCMLHYSRIGESFGMVLAEALMCGTPVVTYSTPLKDNSQVWLIKEGETGYVARSRKTFVKQALQVIDDIRSGKFDPKTLRKDILDRFSNEVVVKKLIRIIQGTPQSEINASALVKEELRKFPFWSKERLLFKVVHHPLIYKWYSSR